MKVRHVLTTKVKTHNQKISCVEKCELIYSPNVLPKEVRPIGQKWQARPQSTRSDEVQEIGPLHPRARKYNIQVPRAE